LNDLAQATGHSDRHQPLKHYCTGLLLPGERKSIEPMAARLAPETTRRMHQSLHHLVADAAWNDEAVMKRIWQRVLPAMTEKNPIVAWVVDDTGFPKKGRHSVGVDRQYCGQVGKQENCRVAVSLSVSTESASLPVAFELYLPVSWTEDSQRRQVAGVPADIEFRTKPLMAIEQIQKAKESGLPLAPVVADAGYGNDTKFRQALTAMEIEYAVGIQSTVSLWRSGEEPLPPKAKKKTGKPSKLRQRSPSHQPATALLIAQELPAGAWKNITWRAGTKKSLRSRFACVRVRPAHRDYERSEPLPEQWLLLEWPKSEPEPTKYWLSTLAPASTLTELVKVAKHRWIIERDYEELKQELGLGHFEGRGWRGFHHHATLCIAAYGFLIAERSRFSPSAGAGALHLSLPPIPDHWRPRGAPATA
jgi:SRSO17 transposase